MKSRIALSLVCVLGTFVSGVASGADEPGAVAPVRIYLDADRTHAVLAGESIEAGMQAAVALAGGAVHGRPIEIVALDHRGNTKRSLRNLQEFADDPDGLAVFTGMHSPPVLKHRDWINGQGILLLDPWAAAGPITRPEGGENWVFRLSVDDTNAGVFLAGRLVEHGWEKPLVLLEDTGWGRANEATMVATIRDRLGVDPLVQWFGWGTTVDAMRLLVGEAIEDGVDSVLFVGNTPEGAALIRVIDELPERERPVLYSHWGVIGGNIVEQAGLEALLRVNPVFIQTRFDLGLDDEGSLGWRGFRAAKELGFFDGVGRPDDICTPTGFVHGFDLMRVFLAAVEQAGLSGDVVADRRAVRAALESLETPVVGLIRVYEQPFDAYTVPGSDQHEALRMSDYGLSRFDERGLIVPWEALAVAGVEDEAGMDTED